MRRLLQSKNVMVSAHAKSKEATCTKYISILNIIQGDADPTQVHKSLQRIRERSLVNFITWGPASMQARLRSPLCVCMGAMVSVCLLCSLACNGSLLHCAATPASRPLVCEGAPSAQGPPRNQSPRASALPRAASKPLGVRYDMQAIHIHVQVALSNQSPYVKSAHRVSGLMLANHTSIRLLIEKCLRGFKKLFPKFYVDHYKDFNLFNDGEGNLVLDEFEDAQEVVQDLCDEYKACEGDDYVSTSMGAAAAPPAAAGGGVVEEYTDSRLRSRTGTTAVQ